MKMMLNGQWKLNSADIKELPARVPGSVLSALLDNKLIEDPFYGYNEEKTRQWLKKDYTFSRTFSLTPEQLEKHNYLFLDGIDTLAKVYINDHFIIELFDMHLQKRILLDNAILKPENEIRIEFRNVYDYIENYPDKEQFETFAVTHPNGPVIRKAHYMLGWDWGPDLADMGIWRDIYMLSTDLGYMESFRHEYTFLPDGSVDITVDVENICHAEGTLTAVLSLKQDGTRLEQTQSLSGANRMVFRLERPVLWYPIGFGDPVLYDLQFTLDAAGEKQKHDYRIGIRKVVIDNSPDRYGTNFEVFVNGVKVFLKGSNYIPEDNILCRADKEHNLRILKLVKDFNHNVIRVWGGGCFPEQWFYDYCDENGILVWQDLMFACASYNVNDRHFKDLIVEEVTDAVKRFRHHASVFYICGDNECEDGANGHAPHIMENYRKMSQEILVPLVKTLTDTFYAYTSPHSRVMYKMQNDFDHFDTHYWWIREAKLPLEDYRKVYPRMLSEVGFESFPMYETIRRVTPEDQMHLYSEVMLLHEKRPTGNQTVEYYVNQRYGQPETFEAFIYLQNLVQGEAMKICAEHLRIHKYRCNGMMFWQINDCWPGLSCSSVDYDFGIKALHYYSKKFFAPHMITACERDGKIVVSVANDTAQDHACQVICRYMDFAGNVLKEHKVRAKIAAAGCADVLSIPSPFDLEAQNKLIYVSLLDDAGNQLSENFFQKFPDKEIVYPPVHIAVKAVDAYTVELTADSFAKNVFLQLGDRVDTVFSDNYFNLISGAPRRITADRPIDPDQLRIKTLNQVKFKR